MFGQPISFDCSDHLVPQDQSGQARLCGHAILMKEGIRTIFRERCPFGAGRSPQGNAIAARSIEEMCL
jgi:hypothetical protein